MKKLNQIVLAALGCLFLANASAQAQKVVGKLAFVEGEVFVDTKPSRTNANVKEGSTVEVKTGKATLLLGSGSVFHLASDTKMVVTQFGAKNQNGEESGDLDLKFGRTRALILNEGNEKKDVKIKARAATMGVRGTEVFINAPRDSNQAVQFFTIEGKAEVKASNQGAPVVLNQNQGVATHSTGANAGSTTAPTMTVAEVKAEIKSVGMEAPPPIHNTESTPPKVAANAAPVSSLSSQWNGTSVPPTVIDPVQNSIEPSAPHPLSITLGPRYCSAKNPGACQ